MQRHVITKGYNVIHAVDRQDYQFLGYQAAVVTHGAGAMHGQTDESRSKISGVTDYATVLHINSTFSTKTQLAGNNIF